MRIPSSPSLICLLSTLDGLDFFLRKGKVILFAKEAAFGSVSPKLRLCQAVAGDDVAVEQTLPQLLNI